MAIMEIKREWSPCQLDYVKTFLLHSEADVKNLPKCCVGSKATVSETDNEYFCTESGWKLGSELDGGAAPVAILPETVLTVDQAEVSILTPLSAFPEVGGTCEVTYNGTAYDCPVVNAPMNDIAAVALGNTAAIDLGDGNGDAPFVVALFPYAQEVGEVVLYGVCIPMDGATSITLSIVQKESGSASASGSGGVCVINVTCDGERNPDTSEYPNAAMDKTFGEIKACYDAGGILMCRLAYTSGEQTDVVFEFPLVQCIKGYGFIFMIDGVSGSIANYIMIAPDDIRVAFN